MNVRAGRLLACAAATVAVVACRQPNETPAPPRNPAPLTADEQARRESRARWDASVAFEKAAREMTPQQVADAEAAWRKNPDDLDALKKLLIYYGPDQSGPVVKDTGANVAARRPLILWLIEHQPESILTWHSDPRFSRLDPVHDREGYEQARKLWLAHTSRADARAPVLDHAATFFQATDPVLAEQLLARARKVDPEAKTLFAKGEPMHWNTRFAEVYCQAMLGADESTRAAVTKKMEVTQDAMLLDAVGRRLRRCAPPGTPVSPAIAALSKQYLERAGVKPAY